MRTRRVGLTGLALGLLLVGLAQMAGADGFIVVPEPPPRVQHFPLAVKNHNVTVRVDGTLATTHVDQVFFNPNDQDLEGTYLFPLPTDASVTAFAMYMNGVKVEGEILERDQARSIYEGIVRQMKDPALLEYVGQGLFKARVFPIPARGNVRLELDYSQVLPESGELVGYRYPLNTEKFSSAPLEECTVDVTITSDRPLGAIFSPTHPVDVIRKGTSQARAVFEAHDVKPDKDFALYFSRPRDELGVELITFEEPGVPGYFMLAMAPRPDLDPERLQPRDVIFVMDTSGSMRGEKMAQAQGALRYCLQALRPQDRFGIVDYSTTVRTLEQELLPADATGIERALYYVDKMKARGGTDIHGALSTAISMLSDRSDRPAMICFLTDGKPTIGVTDPDRIEREITEATGRKARIFVFGAGTDVNTHFLDRLAERNRGTREYVLPDEDIEVKVSAFFEKVSSPVLSDVVLELEGVRVTDRYPKQLPDIFRGGQLLVMGRFEGGKEVQIRLTGHFQQEEVTYGFTRRLDGPQGPDSLPHLWASRKVGYLLDQIRLHGESEELKGEIIRLSMEYGVMTPYTSYLVVEEGTELTGGEMDGRIRELHAGGSTGGAPGRPEPETAEAPAEAFKDAEGRDSIELSRRLEALKQTANQDEAQQGSGSLQATGHLKRVAGRTFYKVGEMWVESRFTDTEEVEVESIELFSPRYFELLAAHADIGRFLALGEQVLFSWQGKWLKVVPPAE